MHLHRVTPDPFENCNSMVGGKFLGRESDKFEHSVLHFAGQPGLPVVKARFDRFGGGSSRKSDFEVLSEWRDVEEMIARFCEAGHPAALELKRARELAEAVKQIGWREPE
jgi:hypothetical protein